ncbi:hypothetical protein SK854_07080 [Lentzea sp. BCCO 10_0061]|uniref:Uncharacterized protein n=1 Tax=Lentzea sokolovensis TaxID=3095429 RepID=A0ABU4UR14_9PSEU|nr:hypothetical protein [Lentzea sp. BCCO 10_0061]MDX8141864.1 hypothetical protein [Lentzea sp. BCCO 10_0061]
MRTPQIPRTHRSLECVPFPTQLARTAVLALLLVFVLVLLGRGYDATTCLALAAGLGVLSVQVGHGFGRPARTWPQVTLAR